MAMQRLVDEVDPDFSIHTSYHSDLFLLRTRVLVNGENTKIEFVKEGSRGEPVMSFCHDGNTISTKLWSIASVLSPILHQYGVYHVDTFYCEQSPLWHVIFSSESCLRFFLLKIPRVRSSMESEILSVFLEFMKINQMESLRSFTVEVQPELFLVSPNLQKAKGAELQLVTIENCSIFVTHWKNSKLFDFGSLYQEKVSSSAISFIPSPTKQTAISTPEPTLTGFMKLTSYQGWKKEEEGKRKFVGRDWAAAATPPQITTQPTSLEEIPTRKPVTISIQASGTEPMNYQWQCWKPEGEEDESEDWQDITCDGVKFQEVKAGLKFTAVQACDAGYYRCVVSNSAGSETSQCANLVVVAALADLVNELTEVNNWIPLGLNLGIKISTLEAIERERITIGERRTQMLIDWQKQETPTWSAVIQALAGMGMRSLASRLAHKHGIPVPKPSKDERLEQLQNISQHEEPTRSKLLAEVQNLMEDISKMDDQLKDSNQRLHDSQKSKQNIDDDMNQLLDNFSELRKKVRNITHERDSIKKELESKQRECQLLIEMRCMIVEKDKQLQQKDSAYNKLLEEKHQKDLELLQEKITKKQEKIEELERKLQKKESELQIAQQIVKAQQAELSQFRAQLKKKHEEMKDLQSENEKLASSCNSAREQVSKLVQLTVTLSSDKGKMEQQLTDTRETSEFKSRQIEACNANISQLNKEVEILSCSLQEKEATVAQLERELQSRQQAAITPEQLLELLKVAPQTAELERRLQEAEYQKQQAELEREIAIKEMEAQKRFQMQLHAQLGTLLKGSIPDAPADVTNGVTGSGSDKSKEEEHTLEEHKRQEETRRIGAEEATLEAVRQKAAWEKAEKESEVNAEAQDDLAIIWDLDDTMHLQGALELFDGSKRQGWIRRWAILHNDVLLFFEMEQDAIRQGWLLKKSNGRRTLSRHNWKHRYFALRGKTLFYYSESNLPTAKPNGAIHLMDITDIVEDGGSQEHSFGIITPVRTYYLMADSEADKREWCETIRHVQSLPELKVRNFVAQEVDPRRATMTIDLEVIHSVTATDQEKTPNAFTVITATQVFNLVSDTSVEMHMWIGALSPKMLSLGNGDLLSTAIAAGWLIKEGSVRRKWFFVLTENRQLYYYRSEDTRQPMAGHITLNSLCVVDPFDEMEAKQGCFTFKLHSQKTTYELTAENAHDANRWIAVLQDTIDGCPPIQTLTERLVLDITKSHRSDLDNIYKRRKILVRTSTPIKAPLLALPYGKPPMPKEKEKLYGTRHSEAVKIFNTFLCQDSMTYPVKQIQEILQKCIDIQDLQPEVFCQLIKQTAGVPLEEMDTPGVLSCWQTLACMCCTFIPERAVKSYLTMHIKKIKKNFPDSEMAEFAAYCQTSLERTKQRDFVPSRSEVVACLGRRDLNTIVFCYGGGQCNISINSGTTAGEVVQKLSLSLHITGENNRFALFEVCGNVSRVIDDSAILADILGKFERKYFAAVKNPIKGFPEKWKLFFKLFCYLRPENVPFDSTEAAFIYEQFCNDVVLGRFPASLERLLKLAALRVQFLEGNYKLGATIDDVGEVFPISWIVQEVKDQQGYGSALLQGANHQPEEDHIRAACEVKKNTVRSSVIDLWRRLEGITPSQAQQKYMELLAECPAFGCTLFEVEHVNKDQRFPKDLWLAVNAKGVQIYQRGAVIPIQTYSYKIIVSFGAPTSNEYRLAVEGQLPISVRTCQVAEIAKLMKAYIMVAAR